MAPRAQAEAAVAATSQRVLLAVLAALVLAPAALGAVLPEERADAMYHRYDGGGMVIDGPSLLVRKNFAEKFSIAANYYVDSVSSASIDVITSGASEYTEERTEQSLDLTYLHEKALINIGYTGSDENDYEASSFRFDISQDFFGDMTTLSLGFSQGNDDITQTGNDAFSDELERRHYRFGIAQIISRTLIANLNYESIIDEGYLQNPYRFILIENGSDYIVAPEVYPRTRNSDAVSVKLAWHTPISSALKVRLGYFDDSWGINAYSIEFDYTHELGNKLLLDARLRAYTQSEADFYANSFTVASAQQNFLGRDKELSSYNSYSIGIGASYDWALQGYFERLSANVQLDWMLFDYDNFREVTPEQTQRFGVGNEPLYDFDAYALRVFLSLFY